MQSPLAPMLQKATSSLGRLLLVVYCVCLAEHGCNSILAQDNAETVPPFLLELLRSPDRDTRGLALQEVREGLRGEAATRQIAEVLPSLDAEGQAALLEALGERGDPTGRSALVTGASSPELNVRLAAVRALGRLGTTADVEFLANRAATGSILERQTARESLAKLRGESIDEAILELIPKATAIVKVELLKVLASRKVTHAEAILVRSARDENPTVRIAAFGALEELATSEHAEALVELLCSATDDIEREAAESAMVAVSQRAPKEAREAVMRTWATSSVSNRLPLLRCLAVIGGPDALRTIVQTVENDTGPLQNEAIGILGAWPGLNAAPHLLKLARRTTNLAHRAISLRGVVRLAAAEEGRPADTTLLAATWKVAKTADEKRVVLGALGGANTLEALALAIEGLDEREVTEEAGLAAVLIVERLRTVYPHESATAMRAVAERVRDVSLRERADKLRRKPAPATP